MHILNEQTINTTCTQICLITGASSGIGFELAYKFAREHYDLILVARDLAKLEQMAIDLQTQYHCRVYPLQADLSNLNSIEKISILLKSENLNIDILVNNAGFGVHGPFVESDLKREIDMVNLQISTTLALTKLVIPNMIKQRRGYILNVGSVYSFVPVPYQSVYGSCKAFLISFSISLAHELKEFNIYISVLCPGVTQTEFRTRSKLKSSIKKSSLIIEKTFKGMTAKQVADEAYKALMKKQLICIPGIKNRFFVNLTRILPFTFVSGIIAFVNEMRGVNSTYKNY